MKCVFQKEIRYSTCTGTTLYIVVIFTCCNAHLHVARSGGSYRILIQCYLHANFIREKIQAPNLAKRLIRKKWTRGGLCAYAILAMV